ncbi:MAG: LysM peptidoglycan-binding domain-containing protein, partial [bacterium]|nr:LysM peptidoglycan-binding domain-containing protein [bacterium]
MNTYQTRISIIFILAAIILNGIVPFKAFAENNTIPILKNLNTSTNETLKALRKDIRKAIYTVKSFRSIDGMPELQFYKYRVKKEDNFWKIMPKSSLDMDTLISVNSLSTAKDIIPGKIIYI